MKFNERKTWQILAAVGFVFTAVCFVVSIFQFFQIRQYDVVPVMKFVSLGINFLAFLGFCYLIFNCMSFWIYALVLYAYGVGNFIDDGNIIGTLCFTITIALLQKLGFFSSHRKTKISLIMVCPILALIFQAHNNDGINFVISMMHIFAAGFLLSILISIIYPAIVPDTTTEYKEKVLDPLKFSKQDIEFLNAVAKGDYYDKIAKMNNMSESKVKARMVELYKMLEVKNKVEFLTLYSRHTFVSGLSISE